MAKSSSTQNLRRQVALEAAKLMLDQNIDDYLVAKTKAADRLGLNESSALPTNQEIELALLENRRLFRGVESDQSVARLRSVALDAMQRLVQYKPRLVGAVLSGAITDVSAIEIHLFTDSIESVAMSLLDDAIEYRLVERRVRYRAEEYRATPVYCFEHNDDEIEAYVFTLNDERQPPLSPIDGKPMERLATKGVSELISKNSSNAVIDGFFS